MPRYLIQRTFTFENELGLPTMQDSLLTHRKFQENNARAGVTWVFSYVTPDGKKSFCIYDAPTPEAVRQAASLNRLTIDRINEVHVLNPVPIPQGGGK